MFAIIRAGIAGKPYDMFSDAEFFALMNEGTEFSLGHFWDAATFGAVDMSYRLLGPVTITDPRPGADDPRGALMQAVIAAVGTVDWTHFSHVIMWFGHPEDYFGGAYPSYPVGVIGPSGAGSSITIPTSVINTHNPLDVICHEVGHAFGLIDALTADFRMYFDPYDIMSAEAYAGAGTAFNRGPSTDVPDGFPIASVPLRKVGPLPSPTKFLRGALAGALRARHIVNVPADLLRPFAFTLSAWGNAVQSRVVSPVVAVIPPQVTDGDTYLLELRAPFGYDRGVDGGPPAAVVIHKFFGLNPAANNAGNQSVYVDALSLDADGMGDQDYHSFAGFFTVRVVSRADDLSWVTLSVGGADYWRNCGTTIRQELKTITRTAGAWQPFEIVANGDPRHDCMVGRYQYRVVRIRQRLTLFASSSGYEKPVTVWSVNGRELPPGTFYGNTFTFEVDVVEPDIAGPRATRRNVTVWITKVGEKLTIESIEAASYRLTVSALTVEGSNEVMKNLYPDTRDELVCSFEGAEIEFDAEYHRRDQICHPRIPRIDLIPIPRIPWIDRGDPPPFVIGDGLLTRALVLEQMIHAAVRQQDRTLLNELLEYGERTLQIPRAQLLARAPNGGRIDTQGKGETKCE